MTINISKAYEEGCATLRHYSEALRNIRTLTIAQGLAVLYSVANLAKENKLVLSLLTAIFGIVLTVILHQLHRLYLHHVKAVAAYIIDLEESLKESGGPWAAIEAKRAEFLTKKVRFALEHAIFVLLILSLMSIIFYDMVKLLNT